MSFRRVSPPTRRSMQKVRYEIDPHNRLVIEGRNKGLGLPQFRKVLDGVFKIDKDNELAYHVKAPLKKDEDTPHQVKLKGTWSLTDSHNLMLTLDKWKRQTFGDRLTLQGEIIDVRKNSLLFAVTTQAKDNVESTYVVELGGAWQADENNRLTFRIKRETSRYDILTFDGAWEIDKNHEIIYRYEKSRLIRKRKVVRTLIFRGRWDIKDNLRISYVLDADTNSAFNFETSLGVFEKDYIKYELGIRLSARPRPVKRTVIIFGTWRIKRPLGLIFEIQYADGRLQSIAFGAEANFTKSDTILFKLKTSADNKDLSATLELSHKILKGDGEAFLKLLKSREESSALLGAALRW